MKIKIKIIGMILVSALIFASKVYALDNIPLMSQEPANKSAYQTYLKDQDKQYKEINYLLSLIKNSSLAFERNGQKGSGKDAAKLLEYKLKQNKNKIHTTEDFIEKVASFSGHTHKNYQVILPQGNKLPLKELLYGELKKLRKQSKGK